VYRPVYETYIISDDSTFASTLVPMFIGSWTVDNQVEIKVDNAFHTVDSAVYDIENSIWTVETGYEGGEIRFTYFVNEQQSKGILGDFYNLNIGSFNRIFVEYLEGTPKLSLIKHDKTHILDDIEAVAFEGTGMYYFDVQIGQIEEGFYVFKLYSKDNLTTHIKPIKLTVDMKIKSILDIITDKVDMIDERTASDNKYVKDTNYKMSHLMKKIT